VLIFKKVEKYKNLGDKYNKKPDDIMPDMEPFFIGMLLISDYKYGTTVSKPIPLDPLIRTCVFC
jgi:hypothetical protein